MQLGIMSLMHLSMHLCKRSCIIELVKMHLFFVMHVLDSGHIRDEVHPQLVKKFYDGFTA